jgi:hypothetical protein
VLNGWRRGGWHPHRNWHGLTRSINSISCSYVRRGIRTSVFSSIGAGGSMRSMNSISRVELKFQRSRISCEPRLSTLSYDPISHRRQARLS